MGNNNIIAIYAAIVGSVALIWQITVFILDKIGRIRVSVSYMTEVMIIGGSADARLIFDVFITNTGARTRYINHPRLTLKIAKTTFQPLNKTEKRIFPYELKPGEQIEFKFEKKDLLPSLGEIVEGEKIKFKVTDTHLKKYESSWLEI